MQTLTYFTNITLMTRIPNFFKVKSRIGLTNPPIRHSEFNYGVEAAPEQIAVDSFLKNFEDYEINEFEFKTPEDILKENYWREVSSELNDFKELIKGKITEDQTQVVLGGDNTVTLSSLEAVIERVGDPSKIGYVQFDSHGEMHQSLTSISKNFHGMYMRPFFDKFDVPEIDGLVPNKMSVSQILAVGNIIFDGENTEEEQFYKTNKIWNVRREAFLENRELVISQIAEFLSRFEHIHINFDIDIFHRSVSEATGLPEDGSWFKEEVFAILDILAIQKNLSVDMVEINPKKEGGEKTVALAQEILLKLLKN